MTDQSPSQRRWSDDPTPERPAVPPPAVPAHWVSPTGRSVRLLIRKLGEGWDCVATCSQGYKFVKGELRGPMACLTVHLFHDTGARAVALFEDEQFAEAFTWVACTDPTCPRYGRDHPIDIPHKIGYRDLCTVLSDEPALSAEGMTWGPTA